jgi:F-type H+-transporting ATPase subunit epsilon
MNSFLLTLLTPQGVAFDGEVTEAYFPSTQGPLGVLPGHTPYVAVLAANGVIRLKTPDKKELFFVIHNGVVEVRPDKTIALTENSLAASSEEVAQNLLEKASPHDVTSIKGSGSSNDLTPPSKETQKPYNKQSQ